MEYHISAFKFITYCLVTTEKQLKQVRKAYGIPKHALPVKRDGARVDFVHFEVGTLAVVQLHDTEHELHEVLGLLAHECVHIKQQVMDDIGEHSPSDEFEAYFVQDLVTTLTKDYLSKTATQSSGFLLSKNSSVS